MDSKLFARLTESMTQMNELINGERAPSREFMEVIERVVVLAPSNFQLLQIESIIRGLKRRQAIKTLRLFGAKGSDQSIAS
ncbi:hypothetical protein V2H77_05660 [Photorhabdus sp. P32]|uniref:hypothetical protein n=1 Tax=Photorhabdus sp. P32 TaxID=3117549 RepID=UPI00311B414B